jgi:hypothetical protein
VAFGATHYNWRPDVGRLARRWRAIYRVSSNTYFGHGTTTSTGTLPGPRLDAVSIDFWHRAGRGHPIPYSKGSRIFRRLRVRRGRPYYRYIIWWGRIYYPNGTDYPYPDQQDQHHDHVHVTFW